MGFSRQAWYQSLTREAGRLKQARYIIAQVTAIRLHQPRPGTRKLYHLLRQSPEPVLHVGRDRLFGILRSARLLVMPLCACHKTTHSHHRFYRHPNLLKERDNQVTVTRPEQVWVADITWLPLKTGTAYISLVTDAWSGKSVGYHVYDSCIPGMLPVHSKWRWQAESVAISAPLRQRYPVLLSGVSVTSSTTWHNLFDD